MEINIITGQIIDTSIQLHRTLGPGLLESVYEKCLEVDLREKGFEVVSQLGVPLKYKNLEFNTGYRLDLLVENQVIVEVKSVETLAPVHFSQLLTYLKLYDKRVGLLINFNSKYLKQGLHRIVNKYED
ncbi:GxxExxY protein [Marixanthomonas spongiae]|uniref:GxxExxY protein n=1 Tax=Marixanthomonas spongiae TaxID=2174845 RepID=A0A2U0I5U5_9FLAO|nr:GxxExxY protein [Marixanthomonas spongiae]PVW16462.1 GxxExxY protein [Marixanthomonas spongiae]